MNSRIFLRRLYIQLGFGTFYTSLLKKSESIASSAGVSDLAKDQGAKMEKLGNFVDIGLKLKHLNKNSNANDGDKDEKQSLADIKEIAETLKKVSMTNGMTSG